MPGDAARARRAFALQDHGALAEADREIASLEDRTLIGPLLANRYSHDRHVTAAAVASWLTHYRDQPDAPAMQALLRRLAPPAAEPDAWHGAGPVRRARALFLDNRDEDAVVAAERQTDPDGLLAGGLAAYRLGRLEQSRGFFEHAYRAAALPDQRAGAAFWTSKVAQTQADYSAALTWRRYAADEPRTFYGVLAARMLAPARSCVFGELIARADIDALMAAPAGRRGFALLQVGQRHRAEDEFLALWAQAGGQEALKQSLFLLARSLNMTALAGEMQASSVRLERAIGHASPGRLRPRDGFVVETPLVYALVRQESNFQPGAVSGAGAQGLMQVMASTAHAVAGVQAALLQDPSVNLAVGQRLLLSLATDDAVSGDLMRILAGYGQGLNGLKRWADTVRDNDDPLLFLEAIPDRRIQAYIQTTLLYDWQYATALHLRAQSLDALAGGRRPMLARVDEVSFSSAECKAR